MDDDDAHQFGNDPHLLHTFKQKMRASRRAAPRPKGWPRGGWWSLHIPDDPRDWEHHHPAVGGVEAHLSATQAPPGCPWSLFYRRALTVGMFLYTLTPSHAKKVPSETTGLPTETQHLHSEWCVTPELNLHVDLVVEGPPEAHLPTATVARQGEGGLDLVVDYRDPEVRRHRLLEIEERDRLFEAVTDADDLKDAEREKVYWDAVEGVAKWPAWMATPLTVRVLSWTWQVQHDVEGPREVQRLGSGDDQT